MDNSNNHKPSGLLIGGLVLVVIVAIVGVVMLKKVNKTEAPQYSTDDTMDTKNFVEEKKVSTNEPPLLIKSMPITMGEFDAATSKAGDFSFTKAKLGEFDRPFFPYGFEIPASSAGPAKKNPQPTFIVPLGTKVRSMVDGVVVNVPVLYSKDYSIQIADDKESQFLYETEHVINPLVKVGDTVKAGQVIADVSDYDSRNMPGFGLVEIGILHGGNPPKHLCPFSYLDPSVKSTVSQQITSLYKAWETYRGKTDIYDESIEPVTGCASLDPVEG